MTVLALEIGPTRFAAIEVVDDVGVEDIRQIPMPANRAWDRCRELLLEVAAGAEVARVGVASAGPIDMAAGVVAPPQVAEWSAGFPLRDKIKSVFPSAVVQVALDGACQALAERNFGALRECQDALTITVTDSIAGGVTLGGFSVVGRTGNAGHIGHVLVPGFDDRCVCGGTGCLEAVASGASILRWARARGWSGDSLEDVIGAAEAGEEVPAEALRRAGTALGRAISSVAALLDIDVVVINGPLATAGNNLWKPMNSEMATHARLSYLPGLRVVPSQVGDVATLAGAGVMALALSA
ncbi:ROK family protein [Nocardia donostiensis]|uniref:Sugar kinase n=1 Tax=Nocardia donostiensis TaxID=1538463 RepID=A0A1W0B8D8_9NOCA|nr:ROK family protein [Nocardia donostiensis]ONM46339.1 sugar kinase [Nocardia donostiensis]OQS16659.1 sugar kinase [Nocardia donostiensis]OQS18656.1 sugar kinase [Nocardia donostiensis]